MHVKVFLLGCIFFPAVVQLETQLRIIHFNDVHGRISQTQQHADSTDECSEQEGHVCYGGMPRLITASKAEKERAETDEVPILFLMGGDSFHGSLLFNLLRWPVLADFLNLLELHALCLGVHEFDDGVDELNSFVNNLSAPILACNIDGVGEPKLLTRIKPSITIEFGNISIGIIGYIHHKFHVTELSGGRVTVKDEMICIEEEAKKLKARGVNVIIGLGHCLFERELEIALTVKELNIIVGSYQHAFLYTGDPPDIEIPDGPYPTLVTEDTGRMVPVVEAYAFSKYLGVLEVVFNEKWEVIRASGNPILLNSKIKQDKAALTKLAKWENVAKNMTSELLAVTRVPLSGNCSFSECNLGNLITDAFVDYAVNYLDSHPELLPKSSWSHVTIAIYQAGGIAQTINPLEGRITPDYIILAMPYVNKLGVFIIKGKYILEALEWSVANYDPSKERINSFLQVSGLHVTYDVSQPVGFRVVQVTARVRHPTDNITAYLPLDLEESYGIVVGTYISKGGDGYTMLREHLQPIRLFERQDTFVVSRYCKKMELIYIGTEERIVFNSSPTKFSIKTIFLLLCVIYHICY